MTNQLERESWAGPNGHFWIRRQRDLDQLMVAVTGTILDRAGLAMVARVLDVGCGTGATTLAAAAAVGPGGQAMGWDLSAPLLELARARAAKAGARNVRFAEGDAQVDAAPGAPFDAMISRFGTMFFEDAVAAFANIAAQLRPSAALVFAAWGPADGNPWFSLPHQCAEARLGVAAPLESDAPGPSAFRDPTRVTELLERAGLRRVGTEMLDLELQHSGGPAALAELATMVGPAARLLRIAGAGDDDRAVLGRDVADALGP